MIRKWGLDWPVVVILTGSLVLGACSKNESQKGITPFHTVEICMDTDVDLRTLDTWCEEQQEGTYWVYVTEVTGEKRELPALNEPLKGKWDNKMPLDTVIGRIPVEGAQFDGKEAD
jgi:hypothetical protein